MPLDANGMVWGGLPTWAYGDLFIVHLNPERFGTDIFSIISGGRDYSSDVLLLAAIALIWFAVRAVE